MPTLEREKGATARGNIPRNGARYRAYLFWKRFFDLFFSCLFLLLFWWLYLLLALLVKAGDGGRVFYRHARVGKGGREIGVLKFRSMKENADRLTFSLTPAERAAYEREYKLDNDPRVTRVGRFLRRTSLDELPNVFAIFKGDLSFVGPRPLMAREVREKYGEDVETLLSVKPGMMGWWSANGRNLVTYESGERQKLELYYVAHCSLWLDLKIVFLSLAGVLRGRGAK